MRHSFKLGKSNSKTVETIFIAVRNFAARFTILQRRHAHSNKLIEQTADKHITAI
jgi:hypothetical protein